MQIQSIMELDKQRKIQEENSYLKEFSKVGHNYDKLVKEYRDSGKGNPRR